MSGPQISERFSSLLSVPRQQGLREIQKRKASASSTLSKAVSVADFVESKVVDDSIGLEYINEMSRGLKEALQGGHLAAAHYNEAMQDIDKYRTPKESKFVLLKRQKKLIKDDLDETLPSATTIADAYANVIMNKVMAATADQKKKKSNQHKFRTAVIKYYGAAASSINEGDKDIVWCHLTGYFPKEYVKAAHIVPKSLESSELSYLFGANEVMLNEPNNGLTLQHKIEQGLNSGKVVLVPLPAVKGVETKWKCVVTMPDLQNRMIFPGTTWKDINGKELTFLTLNRPARRYLYFRYTMTYLHHKQLGTLSWVSQVEAKGTMWATPGPYLRQSMLRSLARAVSDHFLPEAFYPQTFKEVKEDESAARPHEEEGMVFSLAHRLKEEQKAVENQRDGLWDDESDDDDDDDEE